MTDRTNNEQSRNSQESIVLSKTPPLILLLEYSMLDADTALAEIFLTPGKLFLGRGERIGNCRFQAEINGIDIHCTVGEPGDNQVSDWQNLKPVFCVADWLVYRSYVAIDLGDHIASGQISRAVVAEFLSACERLGKGLNAQAVIWKPANIISGFAYFAESVQQYQLGGPFPILALVNFQIPENNGTSETRSDGQAVISLGLNWFSEQELSISSDHLTFAELMRRAVRIAHDVAINGAVTLPMQIGGLDDKETLSLQPSTDLKMLFATVSSKTDE